MFDKLNTPDTHTTYRDYEDTYTKAVTNLVTWENIKLLNFQ